jgi:uncharacterized membrane protein YvlD (DUF360 family)
LIDFYARQLHLALRWAGSRGALVWRGVETLVVAVLSLTVAAWAIPGIRVRDVPSLASAAIVLAALRALLRPVVIAYLSAVSVIVATLVTVLVQMLVFWLIAATGAMAMDDLTDALAGSVVFSIVAALLTAALSTGNDNAFFGTLVRQLAARDPKRAPTDERGVIFIQLDGLAPSILEAQVRAGRTPTIAQWLRSGAMTLDRWEPLLPTQTSASQAGILHGNNDRIPAFRWWDKESRRLLVSNHPQDAREIERRISSGDGLLADGGASIGNLLSGDAPRSFLTASTIDDPAHELRRSHVLDWFFISPYSYVRWILLSIGEVIKELVQAFAERRAGVEPRGPRGFPYPLARAATNVLLRHLTTSLVIEEMYRRVRAIYVDFVDYDEIAHHVGPDRIEARDAIAGLDKIIGLIEKAAADAPMAYRLVVLSDHGQSPGAMFEQRYRKTLEQLIQDLVGEQVSVKGATAHIEHWGRLTPLLSEASGIKGLTGTMTVDRFRRRAGGAKGAEGPPDVVVTASGNLALVSFPAIPGRATMPTINAAHPGLIDGLARHPGVGCVMVRRDDRASVVLGARGSIDVASGETEGADPVAPFGPRALEGLKRLDAMRECGDLVIVSQFDPASGEVAAFESQIGSHGGLGGKQAEAFILHPTDWRVDGPVIGAAAVHAQLRAWVRERT